MATGLAKRSVSVQVRHGSEASSSSVSSSPGVLSQTEVTSPPPPPSPPPTPPLPTKPLSPPTSVFSLPDTYFHRSINTGQTTLPPFDTSGHWWGACKDWLDVSVRKCQFLLGQRLHPSPVLGLLSTTTQPRQPVYLMAHDPTVGWLMDDRGRRQGRVAANGDLRLRGEPGTWDFFNNPFLQPDYYHLDKSGRIGSALQSLAFERSSQNNIAPYLRQLYPHLTGAGTRVGIIDFDPDHLANLQSVLGSPPRGIAPDARITLYPFERAPSTLADDGAPRVAYDQVRSVPELQRLILRDFLVDFTVIQTILATMLKEPKPPDAVIISLTMERRLEYDSLANDVLPTLAQTLAHTRPTGSEAASAPVQELKQWLHAMTTGSETQRQLSIRQFVDTTLEQSPELMGALAKYQDLTKQAADRGTLVLVAAGNSQNLVDHTLPLPADSLLNFMAASPSVLAVGGSDPMGTPSNMVDDKVAAFSNPVHGHTKPWGRSHVDLLAPGVLIPIDAAYLGYPHEQAFNNGTSLSVPWVAGVVCLMKQANPSLSLPQVVEVLKASSVNSGHLPEQQVGAGFLDPVQAIDHVLALKAKDPTVG
jgi:Subtilase family